MSNIWVGVPVAFVLGVVVVLLVMRHDKRRK